MGGGGKKAECCLHLSTSMSCNFQCFIQIWMSKRRYTFSADIWSLGCAIMFVCNRGEHLFKMERQDLVHGMARKMAGWKGLAKSGLERQFSSQLVSLITTMLRPDHHQRPTAQNIARIANAVQCHS